VLALPPKIFPDIVNGEHFVFAEALVKKFKKFLFGNGLGRVAIEEKLGVDFLFPR